jgi:hypothetical protein
MGKSSGRGFLEDFHPNPPTSKIPPRISGERIQDLPESSDILNRRESKMMDLSPIANAIRQVQSPPPQAQPAAAEELKPVPQAQTEVAVPAPPKGGDAGLGENVDVYDEGADTGEGAEGGMQEETKTELLGQNALSPSPPRPDFPFLKLLGTLPLGGSIDATG